MSYDPVFMLFYRIGSGIYNKYAYCSDTPTARIDPSGMIDIDVTNKKSGPCGGWEAKVQYTAKSQKLNKGDLYVFAQAICFFTEGSVTDCIEYCNECFSLFTTPCRPQCYLEFIVDRVQEEGEVKKTDSNSASTYSLPGCTSYGSYETRVHARIIQPNIEGWRDIYEHIQKGTDKQREHIDAGCKVVDVSMNHRIKINDISEVPDWFTETSTIIDAISVDSSAKWFCCSNVANYQITKFPDGSEDIIFDIPENILNRLGL